VRRLALSVREKEGRWSGEGSVSCHFEHSWTPEFPSGVCKGMRYRPPISAASQCPKKVVIFFSMLDVNTSKWGRRICTNRRRVWSHRGSTLSGGRA